MVKPGAFALQKLYQTQATAHPPILDEAQELQVGLNAIVLDVEGLLVVLVVVERPQLLPSCGKHNKKRP